MINPRGVIEVNGVLADFDASRPGPNWSDRWRSRDPLLEAQIRAVARWIGCPHVDMAIGATLHITKVARKLGGRVVSLQDCAPIPKDFPQSWFDK
ncbi:MAG: hypothetical protein H5T92_04785 [Synergistales bacterium]|jgi:hypothetical protein|uniref:hypothetical protein n=1 Tax=Thermogutta sp. TaxID=1962930 RepID=UPI001988C6C9|nr:hypothetical protein [Synergistales bacterium]